MVEYIVIAQLCVIIIDVNMNILPFIIYTVIYCKYNKYDMIIAAIILLFLICTCIGFSQHALLGGSLIINLLFMLLIAVPTPYLVVGSLKSTMPILYLILMGCSIVSMVRYFKTKTKNQCNNNYNYLINYDILMITLPLATSGALFGALIKNLISELLLTIAAIILMTFLTYQSYKSIKSIKSQINNSNNQYNINQYKNNQALQKNQQLLDKNMKELQLFDRNRVQLKFHESTRAQQQINPQLQKILDQQQNRMPKNKIKIVIFILLYTFAILLTKSASATDLIVVNPNIDIPDDFKQQNIQPIVVQASLQLEKQKQKQKEGFGHKIQQSKFNKKIQERGISQKKGFLLDPYFDTYLDSQGLNNCVLGSFVFIIIHLTLSYLSSKSVAIQIASKDTQKQKYGYVFIKQSQKMGSTKMWNCMISGFFGGFVVGIFGIGASIVVVPALINSDIDQSIALHSSAPLTFFSALVSMSLSALNGLYGPYSNLAIILIFLFSIMSSIIVDWVYKNFSKTLSSSKLSRSRILLFLFATSAILLILYGGLGYVAQMDHFTSFGYFC